MELPRQLPESPEAVENLKELFKSWIRGEGPKPGYEFMLEFDSEDIAYAAVYAGEEVRAEVSPEEWEAFRQRINEEMEERHG